MLSFNDKVIIYERKGLLNDPQLLKKFDCRGKPLQQSIKVAFFIFNKSKLVFSVLQFKLRMSMVG